MENDNIISYDWSDKCIMVVDDVQINYNLIQILLRKTKAKLIWASNGQEAVDNYKANPEIDLILMDIRMPVMDGYEATANIKKINKDVPIIAQTAYALVEDREKCVHAGCDNFISKPIIANVLIELINQYISKKPQ
jgi:two-component system, cell cycle response regulator DivK